MLRTVVPPPCGKLPTYADFRQHLGDSRRPVMKGRTLGHHTAAAQEHYQNTKGQGRVEFIPRTTP